MQTSAVSQQGAGQSRQDGSGGVSGSSLTEQLVHICAQGISADDRRCAARLLTDWLGVAAAGAATRTGVSCRAATQAAQAEFSCTALGAPRQSAEQAAFTNGAYGTLLEMDDLHRASILHAGDVVIPAALAAGQEGRCDGARLLDSIVTGYEVALRIGMVAARGGYSAWYNSSTCGIYGAAMAAAHAMGLGDTQKCDALGQAGMQAGGLWQCRLEPTQSKCLATAHAARGGVTAASFARHGLRGPRQILEGEFGFFKTFYPDADSKTLCVQAPNWEIHQVSLKPWPACRHVHPAVGAALAILPDLNIEAVDLITIYTYGAGIAFCDNMNPSNPQEARFSFQHAVAVALLRGGLALQDFTPKQINHLEILELRQKIIVVEDPELSAAFPDRTGARIEVALTDGNKLVQVSRDAPGDPQMQMSSDSVREKFRTNLRAAGVNAEIAGRIYAAIGQLHLAPSLRDLTLALGVASEAIAQRAEKELIE